MKKFFSLLLLVVLAAQAKPPAAVKYLAPLTFPELPDKVVAELQNRKCMVPQYPKGWTIADRINVTRGEFAKAGQKDWAVVCAPSPAGDVSILFFWNGSDKDPGELKIGERNAYWFTGLISQDLLKRKYADKMPDLKMDHDGIGITDSKDNTTIQYFQDGKWTSFRGVPLDTGR